MVTIRTALVLTACLALASCGTTYVAQAAKGQLQILTARKPITKVLADPAADAGLKQRLEVVREARSFAWRELGLPNNKSYTSYADLKRDYVVWSVVATPEFSVAPREWCFPIVGCVAYRGYFKQAKAQKYADKLRAEGFDTLVEGVPAYSTLGKFSDPVLSSMLRYGDDELAATVFHELAHQLLYVRDDSAFNEAFATTVEDEGLRRWLEHQGTAARISEYRVEQAREERFVKLLAEARGRLARLYASSLSPGLLRERKAQEFAALADEIHAFEQRERVTYPLYDEWIKQGLNNARLASVATYYDCVPGFRKLLAQEGQDLSRFYEAARALSKLPRGERHARLCGATATVADEAAD